MLKKTLSVFVLSLLILSCGETVDDSIDSDDIVVTKQNEDQIGESTEEDEEKDQYEQGWESFKKAVLSKDIRAVAAFASSDQIDSELLVMMIMENEGFKNQFEKTSFGDLVESDSEFGKMYEFSANESTTIDGFEVESSIMLYFSKGETGLMLDVFNAAG